MLTTFDLSIIVVNYNTRDLLIECLKSIYGECNSQLVFECIVVDNKSPDDSVSAVKEMFPQVGIIANSRNAYFSAANNQGVAQAQGRYILALNSDTLVQGNTLKQLVDYMDNHPEVGAATTCLYFPDKRLQKNGSHQTTFPYLAMHYSFIGKLLSKRMRAYDDWLWYADWDRHTEREIGVLPGSCIIAPREIWRTVGGFNAEMLMYFSDDYFCRQVQKYGKKTMYVITDGIVHYEGQSAKQISAGSLCIYFHDLLVYTRLAFGRLAVVVLAPLVFPTWLLQRLKIH